MSNRKGADAGAASAYRGTWVNTTSYNINDQVSKSYGLYVALVASLNADPEAPAGVPYSAAVLADTPYIYYRLGEQVGASAQDSSGNAIGTTTQGGVTYGVPGLVQGDTAASFNSGLIYSNAVGSLASPSVTVEFLIKTTATNTSIVRNDFNESSRVWGLSTNPNGTVNWFIINGGSVGQAAGVKNICDGFAHHVVVTCDGTTTKIYVDGLLDSSTVTNTAIPQLAGQRLEIGAHYLGGSLFQPTTGVLDEVAYYKSILSAARVAAHYAAVASGGAWRMIANLEPMPVVVAQSAPYTMAASDEGILASGATTITLPTAASARQGRLYTIKNIGTATVTVAPQGASTIDNAASFALLALDSVSLVTDGTNWWVI